MTLFDFIVKVIVPIFVVGGAAFIVYGQYLLMSDRDEYKRKHGVDPWRHGWDKDEKQD